MSVGAVSSRIQELQSRVIEERDRLSEDDPIGPRLGWNTWAVSQQPAGPVVIVSLVGFRGASDARFMAEMGAQTIVLGPGDIAQAHRVALRINLHWPQLIVQTAASKPCRETAERAP